GAGHTVQVANGTYVEQLIDKIPSGSSWTSPFTLISANRRGAVISPVTPTQTHMGLIAFNASGEHYILIQGFVIDSRNNQTVGISFSAFNAGDQNNIKIVDNEIKNNNCEGITSSGATGIQVLNNLVHDQNSSTTAFCHGIYASDSAQNWIVEGNEVYNFNDYGIHFYGVNIANNVVRQNSTHDNGAIYGGSGIIVGGSGNSVYNNISYKT